jgi:hypothetical protein
VKLTPAQNVALQLLAQATPDEDGYQGLMWTEKGARLEDGTAWLYFRTCLALEKKGGVILDYRFGRVRTTTKGRLARRPIADSTGPLSTAHKNRSAKNRRWPQG